MHADLEQASHVSKLQACTDPILWHHCCLCCIFIFWWVYGKHRAFDCSRLTGDPPVEMTCELWSGGHAAATFWKAAQQEMQSSSLAKQACFQVWSAKGTKWITYGECTEDIWQEAYEPLADAAFRSLEAQEHHRGHVRTRCDLPTRTELVSNPCNSWIVEF